MKTKTSKRILSIFLTVLMLMSSFSMMFAYAEDAHTHSEDPDAPKDYATAANGDKLWDVDFSSQYFTAVDDTTTAFDGTGGTCSAGSSANKGIATTRWRNAVTTNATIVEESGAALKMDSSDVTGTTNQYSGYINGYDLDNKTYTYEFEYFRTPSLTRSKFYFGYTYTGDTQFA